MGLLAHGLVEPNKKVSFENQHARTYRTRPAVSRCAVHCNNRAPILSTITRIGRAAPRLTLLRPIRTLSSQRC